MKANKEITETIKNPEVEQIFNKIEKVPCVGGVLVSVFKENTGDWEIIKDKIYGKVSKIKFGEFNPVMRIVNYHEYHEAYLSIFDLTKSSPKEIEEKEWYKEVVSFDAYIDNELTSYTRIYIKVVFPIHFSFRTVHLPNDEYIRFNNWLIGIISDVNAKAFQSHIGEKEKEIQEKNRRKELIAKYGEERFKEYFGS